MLIWFDARIQRLRKYCCHQSYCMMYCNINDDLIGNGWCTVSWYCWLYFNMYNLLCCSWWLTPNDSTYDHILNANLIVALQVHELMEDFTYKITFTTRNTTDGFTLVRRCQYTTLHTHSMGGVNIRHYIATPHNFIFHHIFITMI